MTLRFFSMTVRSRSVGLARALDAALPVRDEGLAHVEVADKDRLREMLTLA
jgi:hypothetical protein